MVEPRSGGDSDGGEGEGRSLPDDRAAIIRRAVIPSLTALALAVLGMLWVQDQQTGASSVDVAAQQR